MHLPYQVDLSRRPVEIAGAGKGVDKASARDSLFGRHRKPERNFPKKPGWQKQICSEQDNLVGLLTITIGEKSV
jgi:hypothetical protein